MAKRILNKWQITLKLHRDVLRIERGWKYFEFGIFKLKWIPEEGEILRKSHYSGFIIKFFIWFPIERV